MKSSPTLTGSPAEILHEYRRVRLALRRALDDTVPAVAEAALIASVGETVERALYANPTDGQKTLALLLEVAQRLEVHLDAARRGQRPH